MSVAELSRQTGISHNSLTTIYHSTLGGIRMDTLDKICEVLGCKVGDLLEHVPNSQS